jgi:hypothetical protein
MAEMFVTCPDCLARVRLGGAHGRLIGYKGKCKQKKHPTNRPYRSAKRRPARSRMAEGVGFEPTVRFPVHTLSKRAP